MNLVLDKLTLLNFRGVTEQVIEPKGANCIISGDNELGKTTLGDGLHWLFTDKDMQGRSPLKNKMTAASFPLKPLDDHGNEIHHLECTVEAVFTFDGEELVLRKVFKENHTKPRGQAKKIFSGNTNEYYVDGVKKSAANFKIAVAEIASIDVIMMLLTPFYFSAGLKWEKRREIVMQISGDVPDEDVIKSLIELESLPAILGKKSVSDKMAEVKASRTKINGQINEIPTRIDENSKKLPDISDIDQEAVSKEAVQIKVDISDKQKELVKVEEGGADAALETSLAQVNSAISGHVITAENILANQVRQQEDIVSKLKREMADATAEKRRITNSKSARLTYMTNSQADLESLKGDYDAILGSQFVEDIGRICDKCGVETPAKNQLGAFNLGRKYQLEEINKKGANINGERVLVQEKINATDKKIVAQQKIIDDRKVSLANAEPVLANLKTANPNVEAIEGYKEAFTERQTIEGQIKNLTAAADTSELSGKLLKELGDFISRQKVVDAEVTMLNDHANIEKRNQELKDEETKASAEFETLESHLFLMEKFIRTKVSMLNSKVQAKFPGIEFKFFSDAINGGLDECCEVMCDGVPYGGANTAARIKKGLAIITTLSGHYEVLMPVLIDNAEAVINFEPVPMQTIKLAASKDQQITCTTE